MTLPKITQENVHIFIPLKAAKVAYRYSKEHGISAKDALLEFYNSKTYKALEREETKMWHEGVNYIYEEFEEEKEVRK